MASPTHAGNNFDLLRIVAALMVVGGHAYVLSGRAAEEPLVRYTGLGGFGELGVSVFFVISGFLVTGSFERLGRTRAYLLNRCLRILPGLAVAVTLTALLAAAVTTLPKEVYFSQPQTWLYPVRNVLLYPVAYELPGVFAANPYPLAVNGSLWTLRLEFSLYLLLPLMAWPGLFNRTGVTAAVAGALLIYLGVLAWGPEHVPVVILIAIRNIYLFMAGAALFVWRDRFRPQRAAVLAPALAVFLVSALSDTFAPAVAVAAIPLVVVGLALNPVRGLSGPMRFGDLSYGVYIYAFPVQQALMQAFGPQLGLPVFIGATLAFVLPLAAASWWLVERPALSFKPRGAGREAAPAGPSSVLTRVGLS